MKNKTRCNDFQNPCLTLGSTCPQALNAEIYISFKQTEGWSLLHKPRACGGAEDLLATTSAEETGTLWSLGKSKNSRTLAGNKRNTWGGKYSVSCVCVWTFCMCLHTFSYSLFTSVHLSFNLRNMWNQCLQNLKQRSQHNNSSIIEVKHQEWGLAKEKQCKNHVFFYSLYNIHSVLGTKPTWEFDT